MSAFPQADALCRTLDPLDWTSAQRSNFVAACKEIATFHAEHSPEIARLYARESFDPSSIETEDDIAHIPMVGVTAMKHFLLTSKADEKAVLRLTSSGTSGQKTQIWFDEESLARVQATLASLWRQEGLVSDAPTHYLMFVYNPEQAKDLGIAFSCQNMQRFAPKRSVHFALELNAQGEWEFDKARFAQVARELLADGAPLRLIGIPSFIWEFAEWCRENARLAFPAGSTVITGGGWKAAEDRRVAPSVFRGMLSEVFGIEPYNVRDAYGMAEHAAPYLHCAHHRFHVPAFARVIPRDPVSLAPVAPGELGLLELVCPYNTMMPNLALLSTDLGTIDPEPCPCGRAAPSFSIVGRAGRSKHKGCAITADELVKRSA